jgi:SAM-dependent methyltransferase
MGINISTIRLIANTMKRLKLSGSCITLGVQGIEGRYSDIKKILMEGSYNFRELDEKEISYDDKTQFGNSLHQDSFFKMLGFSNVDSLDYFPNENPTYIVDLNKPLRLELWNRYDMVYDGGTLEHCLNTKEVLSNVIKLLKVGGRAVHHVPMNGWINHGLYQFSPRLFFDFYGSNGFVDMKAIIQLYGTRYFVDYDPGLISGFNHMGKVTTIFFTAQKGTETERIKELHYIKFGGEESEAEKNSNTSFRDHVKNMLAKLPKNNLSELLLAVARKFDIMYKKFNIYRNMIRLK